MLIIKIIPVVELVCHLTIVVSGPNADRLANTEPISFVFYIDSSDRVSTGLLSFMLNILCSFHSFYTRPPFSGCIVSPELDGIWADWLLRSRTSLV